MSRRVFAVAVALALAIAAMAARCGLRDDSHVKGVGESPQHAGSPPPMHRASLAVQREATESTENPPLTPAGEAPLSLPASSVTINVYDSTGLPVAGARVFLAGRDGLLLQGVSSESGSVVFEHVLPGRKAITAERSGGILVDVRSGVDSEHELYMNAGYDVKVRATRSNGLAIAECHAFISCQPDTPYGAEVGQTDSNGWLEIRGIEHGRLLWLTADGYLPSYAQPVVETGELTVVLIEGGYDLCGTVRDAATGAGIAASIDLEGYTNAGSVAGPYGTTRIMLPPPPQSVVASEDGGFCVAVSEYAGLRLRVRAKGYASSMLQLTPEVLGHSALRIELERSSILVGSVYDETGNPIAHCRVSARLPDGRESSAPETEEDGRFVILDAPRGTAMVRAVGPNGYQGSVVLSTLDSASISIVCSNESAIPILVLGPGLSPVAECYLGRVATRSSDEDVHGARYLGFTDEFGICRVREEDLGEQCFIGAFMNKRLDTFPIQEVPWTPGQRQVELSLPYLEGSDLRVEVDNASDGMSVFLHSTDGRGRIGRGIGSGLCVYEDLPPGTYRVALCIGNVEHDLGLVDIALGEQEVIRANAGAYAASYK